MSGYWFDGGRDDEGRQRSDTWVSTSSGGSSSSSSGCGLFLFLLLSLPTLGLAGVALLVGRWAA